jgi:hypothetical protein
LLAYPYISKNPCSIGDWRLEIGDWGLLAYPYISKNPCSIGDWRLGIAYPSKSIVTCKTAHSTPLFRRAQ